MRLQLSHMQHRHCRAMDKGYFGSAEILTAHQAGIPATVPRPETSGNRSKARFVKADFAHDPARGVHVCPAGDDLIYRYTQEEDGLQMRRYRTGNCGDCPVRNRAPPARSAASGAGSTSTWSRTCRPYQPGTKTR